MFYIATIVFLLVGIGFGLWLTLRVDKKLGD